MLSSLGVDTLVVGRSDLGVRERVGCNFHGRGDRGGAEQRHPGKCPNQLAREPHSVHRGGPKAGVPGTIVPPGVTAPVLPPVVASVEDLPPRAAIATPPAAAPPITTASTTHLDRDDAPTGSALVWVRTALAASPCHDAVTRIRNGPSVRFGTSPRATAMPRSRFGR